MLTMQRKELLKRSSIRYAEYYGMVEVQDALYRDSAGKKIFTDLISVISSEANIKMAYRNLKTNDGSSTPGVDGKTFDDLGSMSEESLVKCVQDKILNYQPKAVRRVYIPKPNGKMRPLGIPTVIDRIVQQSVLQVMEPICEAKFYRHSYGFRPNRSTKNAVAVCYKLAQVDGFHYVVDVDIKGFFDNVDHGKLLKQIWTLGIRDKRLISLIGKMLKAPIEENGERTVPDKGTPQGGVLSPLLANIVLNELDWWVASQWEEMPVRHPTKSDIYQNSNGSLNKGNLYKKLRQTRLKECHIVRYADDFKIFCRTYAEAVRLKCAVEQWLKDRLKLETSPEKSRITNLTKGYSEFLGIQFKLHRKGKRWAIKSHMTEKAITNQQKKLKNAIAKACKSHESEQSQHDDIIRYNQAVIGMHQYYCMTTMINEDVHRLFPSIDITMKTRLNSRADLSKDKPPTLKGAMDEYFYQKYGESEQVRYINGMIVVPVAYCRTQNPMFHRSEINRYTAKGRELIHRMLAKEEYGETLYQLSRTKDAVHSIEFCDNRLSRFVAARGKCELSKVPLAFEDVECIHLNPPSQGGKDEYTNLRIVHKDVRHLIYETDVKIIKSLIDRYELRAPAKIAKLNKWRAKAGLAPINLITINQTLK
ncbi:TPA: group II intron reverse transcriptase/maturase [Streptococcus pyogenes]|nr:group II intron reverse transcriptase/maturase [Streptococcus pyogenes]